MKVAIVGSSSLDMKKAAGPVLSVMLTLPPSTVVLVRRPAHETGSAPGLFEQLVTRLCETLKLEYRTCSPDLMNYEGRAATYERDVRMAQQGDRVIAFFPEGESLTGGTGHVVEKFHDLEKPSECYEVGEGGSYRWIGGMERALTS